MRADLERLLVDCIILGHHEGRPGAARDAIALLVARGILTSDKPAYATLEKWWRHGWWDYGVSLHCGWFQPGGVDSVREAQARRAQTERVTGSNSS